MKIVSALQIKEIDRATINKQNISSHELMERAAAAFVEWFIIKFSTNKPVYIFCGPGNNGRDGLAISRLLLRRGYNISVFNLPSINPSENNIYNYSLLKDLISVIPLKSTKDFPVIPQQSVIIDALYGAGLNKPLGSFVSSLVDHINNSNAEIIAVDIASGLYSDKSSKGNIIIKPDYTVAFQLPKLAFMLPENTEYVGNWKLLNIGLDKQAIEVVMSDIEYLESASIFPLIKKREKFTHKGSFGKSLIIGGSYGMIGAMVLSSKACYRTGAGLVTAYVPGCGYEIFQTVLPEAMVSTDESLKEISKMPDIEGYNAISIGPGMSEGRKTAKILEKLLVQIKVPLVLDAGALNLIGKDKKLLKLIPPNSILTPHPKEFERLTKAYSNDFDRLEGLKSFSKEICSFVILKGAHTAIAFPDGKLFFNSTGNPGMAKGGSGDVLTGIITGLLSQSYNPSEAVLLGVYMHGYAGDSAVCFKSEHSILASDIIEGITEFYRAVL